MMILADTRSDDDESHKNKCERNMSDTALR